MIEGNDFFFDEIDILYIFFMCCFLDFVIKVEC